MTTVPLSNARYLRLCEKYGRPQLGWHALSDIAETEITFAVHIAVLSGQLVMVRHQARDTWELPGGRREPGELITHTAERELREECGARDPQIKPLGVYSVQLGPERSYGLLCHSRFQQMEGPDPQLEIAEARCWEGLPKKWTYPEIQGALLHHFLTLAPGSRFPPSLLSILADSPLVD